MSAIEYKPYKGIITNWTKVKLEKSPMGLPYRICGTHAGEDILTSRVVKQEGNIITTRNSVYKLA